MASVRSFLELLKNNPRTQFSIGELDYAHADLADIQTLAQAIKTSQNKTSVSFYDMDWTLVEFNKIEPLFKVIQDNLEIIKLSLMNSHLENATDNTLKGILKYVSVGPIKFLDLRGNSVKSSDKLAQFLVEISNTNISSVNCDNMDLEKCPYSTLEKIVKALVNSKSLKSLSLKFFDCEEEPDKFLQLLKILFEGNLSEVLLPNSGFNLRFYEDGSDPNKDMQQFAEMIKIFENAKQLKSLSLANCHLESLSISADEPDFKYNANIFIEMFERFLQTTTLEKIDISGNDFSVEVTQRFIRAIVSNPSIKDFRAENQEMKESEVREYVEVLKNKSIANMQQKQGQVNLTEKEEEHKEASESFYKQTPLILSSSPNPLNTKLTNQTTHHSTVSPKTPKT